MKRREFFTLFGGAAAWPLAARAQQPDPAIRRIGVLTAWAADDPAAQVRIAAFMEGLEQLGWIVDRNVRVDISQDRESTRPRSSGQPARPAESAIK